MVYKFPKPNTAGKTVTNKGSNAVKVARTTSRQRAAGIKESVAPALQPTGQPRPTKRVEGDSSFVKAYTRNKPGGTTITDRTWATADRGTGGVGARTAAQNAAARASATGKRRGKSVDTRKG